MMLPAGGRQHRGSIIPQAVTHSLSAPEDGRDHRPKHVELIGIVNKPLLLHPLVGVNIIYIVHGCYVCIMDQVLSHTPQADVSDSA